MKDTIKEKYLPIGTVLMLKNGKKRVMVAGYKGMSPDRPDEIYDYIGVLFPEGIIDINQTLLFNHEQIEQVSHYGLVDLEEQEFINKLNRLGENETLD